MDLKRCFQSCIRKYTLSESSQKKNTVILTYLTHSISFGKLNSSEITTKIAGPLSKSDGSVPSNTFF